MITRRSGLALFALAFAVITVLYARNSPGGTPTATKSSVTSTAESGPRRESVAPTPNHDLPACAVPIRLSSWFDEHNTAERPQYSSVPSAVTDGGLAQRLVHRGSPKDTGVQKIEVFKTSDQHSIGAGWSLTFQVWVVGRFTGTYGIMGIEAFDEKYVYLNEADVNFTPSYSPAIVTVQYTAPPRTSHVAVYMQAPEQYPASSFDLTLDTPMLYAVKTVKGATASDGRSVLDCPAKNG